jgi:hypothetical protein
MAICVAANLGGQSTAKNIVMEQNLKKHIQLPLCQANLQLSANIVSRWTALNIDTRNHLTLAGLPGYDNSVFSMLFYLTGADYA